MRQGPNSRRSRGRSSNNTNNNNNNNRRQNVPLRHQNFDSNGPDVRIRGNAWQVHEKYQALARDAAASGDRVMSENYLQHAEHYFRIISQIQEAENRQRGNQPNGQPPVANGASAEDEEEEDEGDGAVDDRAPINL
jgi:hypothetical protein